MKPTNVFLCLCIGILIAAVSATAGFLVGVSSNEFLQDVVQGAFVGEQDAKIDRPKRYRRARFRFNYPANWTLRNELADEYDPDSYFSIDSPAASYCLVMVYQVAIDTDSAVEDQLEYYRKLYTSRREKPFEQWGRFRGAGVELSGKMLGTPGGVRVFSHSSDDNAFTIVECFDQDTYRMTQPGFRLIANTFRIISTEDTSDEIAAFPKVTQETEHYIHPWQEQLLAKATRVVSLAYGARQISFHPNGRINVAEPERIVAYEKGTDEPSILYEFGAWHYDRTVAIWNDDLFCTGMDGSVYRIGEETRPADFNADIIGTMDDERILIVRHTRIPFTAGFDWPERIDGSQLVVRTLDGNETVLYTSRERYLNQICVNAARTEVLVSANTASNHGDTSQALLVVSVANKTVRSLSEWDVVTALGMSSTGWLITGKPRDGAPGIYQLDESGSRLLISGNELTGIQADGKTLIFRTRTKLPGDVAGRYSEVIYEVPIDVVNRSGRNFMPLYSGIIERMAVRIFGRMEERSLGINIFGDADSYASFVQMVEEEFQNTVGLPLPLETAYFDKVLGAMQYETLQHESVIVLASLLCETLESNGAIHIPNGDAKQTSLEQSDFSKLHNDFAFAVNPVSVVQRCLLGHDDWYDPAHSIVEQSQGRKVLFGTDFAAMKAKCNEAQQDVKPVLDSLDATKIGELIASVPENVWLRRQIYGRLAAQKQWALIVDVAGNLAETGLLRLEDRKGLLAARMALEPESNELAQIIDQLKDAITEYPGEASFYVVLGQGYEREKGLESAMKAKACYQQALQLNPHYALKAHITAALERFNDP